MKRREFLALGAVAGVSASFQAAAADAGGGRQFYELRRYVFGEAEDAKAKDLAKRFNNFARDAAVPALNRLGLKPVGVFFPAGTADRGPRKEEFAYVLIPHPSMESVATLAERLMEDSEFLSAGSDYLEATRENAPYKRIESSLLHAFTGMPRLETPVKTPGRVLQLRIYESPTEATNLKKIEMFNEAGEIRIFRAVGLAPVFFGKAIVGDRLPNLTYMLAFESKARLRENWGKFVSHPDWQTLKGMTEYADKAILTGITNILLTPADCSQI